jgi:hypothetical protein
LPKRPMCVCCVHLSPTLVRRDPISTWLSFRGPCVGDTNLPLVPIPTTIAHTPTSATSDRMQRHSDSN